MSAIRRLVFQTARYIHIVNLITYTVPVKKVRQQALVNFFKFSVYHCNARAYNVLFYAVSSNACPMQTFSNLSQETLLYDSFDQVQVQILKHFMFFSENHFRISFQVYDKSSANKQYLQLIQQISKKRLL